MPATDGRVELVYVAGYGRSGSTLLDLVLGRELDAVSCGELWRLFDDAAHCRPCSCGAPLVECPFWGPVLSSVQSDLSSGFEALHEVSAECEFSRRASPRAWMDLWGRTFDAVHRTHGSVRMVDSSKTSGGMRRASLLLACPEVRVVVVVHLVRDLRAVIHSLRRGSNRALESLDRRQRRGLALRGVAGWVRANAAVVRLARSTDVPLVKVRYEDLATRPSEIVETIAARAGWSQGSAEGRWPAHVVGGNRLARSGWDGTVRADEEWRTALPRRWQVLGGVVQRFCQLVGLT